MCVSTRLGYISITFTTDSLLSFYHIPGVPPAAVTKVGNQSTM